MCKYELPVECFRTLVLTFFKTFCMPVFLSFSVFFFKVNSGFFLHDRVATLVIKCLFQGRAPEMLPKIQDPIYSS